MARWHVAVLGSMIVGMVTVGCGDKDPLRSPLTPAEASRCGARGAPISLAVLVRAFRANGIALDLAADSCRSTPQERRRAGLADATNSGESGIDQSSDAAAREGGVLCGLQQSVGRNVRVYKPSGQTETYLGVVNVGCSLYPSDQASEKRQVDRVAQALAAAARAAE
jgi:hypothetical protein